MEINAVAKLDDKFVQCTGRIENHLIKEFQAYVTWELRNDEKLIISKSENYSSRNKIDDEQSLIDRIIKKIKNSRIRREKYLIELN